MKGKQTENKQPTTENSQQQKITNQQVPDIRERNISDMAVINGP